MCSIPHFQFYDHKPKMPVDLSPLSLYFKMFDSAKFFACRVYNLHFEIIKQIQTGNEQYKFLADLHRYHDARNVGDYFILDPHGVL